MMKTLMDQLDVTFHSPQAMARASRTAADTEAHNHYYSKAERERRAAYHIAEAERLERLADDRQGE